MLTLTRKIAVEYTGGCPHCGCKYITQIGYLQDSKTKEYFDLYTCDSGNCEKSFKIIIQE